MTASVTTAPALRDLQEWLAAVTRHPATADVAIRSRAARAVFAPGAVTRGEVVRRRDGVDPIQRLQVYNGAYLGRLQEVLASDFPALQHLLGDEQWHALTARYVARHPSRDPNLIGLGARLPAFVARQRALPRRAFARDLAALEWAIASAFSAPEFAPLRGEALTALSPDDWERARLQLNPSVRLLRTGHAVNAWYVAFREGRDLPATTPQREHTLVYRQEHDRCDLRVWRAALAPAAFAVLTALHAGAPLGSALDRAGGDDRVGAWFREWSGSGLFTAVGLGD